MATRPTTCVFGYKHHALFVNTIPNKNLTNLSKDIMCPQDEKKGFYYLLMVQRNKKICKKTV